MFIYIFIYDCNYANEKSEMDKCPEDEMKWSKSYGMHVSYG